MASAVADAVEGSALKIGLATTKKVVLLSGAKDLLLHFHGLGCNTLSCPIAFVFSKFRFCGDSPRTREATVRKLAGTVDEALTRANSW
jgi:hypothetical protein